MSLVTQSNASPTRKWTFGAATAALLCGLLFAFYPDQYGRLPPGFELALGAFIGKLVEYFVHDHAPNASERV